MHIEVRLFASFREGRFKNRIFELEHETKVADIASMICLEDLAESIIVVNGKHSKPEHALKDGDVLYLIPVVDGG